MHQISEISQNLGCSAQSIRRLCNMGLIPHVKRGIKRERLFTDEQAELIDILLGMKACGFRTKDLRHFSRLYRQGPSMAATRLAILTTRKHQLQQEIKDRQTAIDFIERQEEIYQDNIDNNTNKC